MIKNKFIVRIFYALTLLLFGALITFANIYPLNCEDIPSNAIGLCQLDKHLTVYSKPDFSSRVRFESSIDYQNLKQSKQDNLFAVLVPDKELGYAYVTDISDDEEWLEVIFDKSSNKRGWVHKNDDFQFLNWTDFLNLYGRKYGLTKLISEEIRIMGIYSNPDNNAQVIGNLTRAKSIRLTSTEGIWVLVTVLDFSGKVTTGYIKWRDESGKIYLFPILK